MTPLLLPSPTTRGGPPDITQPDGLGIEAACDDAGRMKEATDDLRRVCEAASDLAASLPDPDPLDYATLEEWITVHWNASFAWAVARLARTVTAMCDSRMSEVSLVTRAMMELARRLCEKEPRL